MKKLFFGALTMVALLASCTSEDEVVANNNVVEDNDLVEIKLGTGSRIGTAVSRAALDQWNNTEIGIYALAKEVTAWSNDGVTTDQVPVLLENVKGYVQADTNNVQSNVTFEKNKTYYYPRTNGYAYNFYGYYPTGEGITASSNTGNTAISVTGPFDGTQDIMWGKAEVVDGAYNANYFRTNNGAKTPDIEFNHLTTRFVFNINAGHDYSAAFCAVDSINIVLPTTYTLSVADLASDNSTEGVLTFNTAESAKCAAITYPETNWDPIVLTESGGTYQEAKDVADIMVPTQESYVFSLVMVNSGEDTEKYIVSTPVSLIAGATGMPSSFEAGKKYAVTLTINGPKEIAVTATLTAWEDGDNINMDI